MAMTLHVDIVSAEKELFSGAAEMVSAPGEMGELGILPRHSQLLTRLKPGQVRVQLQGGEEQLFYVSGGLLEVQPHLVTILTDTAERARDLDEAAAQAAKQRAEQVIANSRGEFEYAKAKAELHRSLERLRVDSEDLIQLHALVHPDEWDTAMGPGGALEACIEAREQGLVRFIGVTGHGRTIAAMHRRSLARFDFDSVLLPYSYTVMQDEVYEHDFEALVKTCQERNVAVQTIKSITRGPWATTERSRSTWYQPLENQADIDVAVQWVIGRPGIFLNTVGDIHLLPKVLDAAARFERRPTDAEMKAVVEQEPMTALFV